jgi:predicted permease
MITTILLILPDFALILLGLLLARRFGYERGFWNGAEKLVYYVLFPGLLFTSINAAQFTLGGEAKALGVAVAAFLCAVALGFVARLARPPADVYASCVQTAFRYNSYVGLALAQSLLGARGVALLALILAVCVPLANVFAVYALARHRKTGLARELVTNPLIVSTVAGLASNLLGWKLPALAAGFLAKLGNASLALGLMCIGAGLTLAGVHAHRGLIAYFSVVKLAVFPLLALVFAKLIGLGSLETQLVVLFAALPTASTTYMLAARLGGNAPPVAATVTAQTLVSMATMPFWILLAAR